MKSLLDLIKHYEDVASLCDEQGDDVSLEMGRIYRSVLMDLAPVHHTLLEVAGHDTTQDTINDINRLLDDLTHPGENR